MPRLISRNQLNQAHPGLDELPRAWSSSFDRDQRTGCKSEMASHDKTKSSISITLLKRQGVKKKGTAPTKTPRDVFADVSEDDEAPAAKKSRSSSIKTRSKAKYAAKNNKISQPDALMPNPSKSPR